MQADFSNDSRSFQTEIHQHEMLHKNFEELTTHLIPFTTVTEKPIKCSNV